MTALYILAFGVCALSAVIIMKRPTTRSNSLAFLLLGLAGQTLLFTPPIADRVDLLAANVSGPLGDLLFSFSLLMLFFWLKPSRRTHASAFFLASMLILSVCSAIDGAPFASSEPLAFAQSITGTVYALAYCAIMIVGGIALLRLKAVQSVRVSQLVIGLLRFAGGLCLTYVALRLILPLTPDSLEWRANLLRTIAASGIAFFAGAIIFGACATSFYNWRVQSGVDNLIRKKFGGRSPNGTEEYLYLHGPLGRTSDTIVNAATYYPATFPALGGSDGVPLRRLLMYLRVFD